MRYMRCRKRVTANAELAIGNMVRRVLHIIREEAKQEEFDDAKPLISQPANAEAPRNQVLGSIVSVHSYPVRQ